MGHWNYSNIGFIGNNVEETKKLLECMGVSFDIGEQFEDGLFEKYHISQAGVINSSFDDVNCIYGSLPDKFKPIEIYTIVNKLFGSTTILCEHEEGNSINDTIYRHEEVYDPEENKVYYAEKDYCYDGCIAFGESVFESLKKECEREAKKQGVSVEWGEYGPEGDFYTLCEKILKAHGGLEEMGTKEWTESIPMTEIGSDKLIDIIKKARQKGDKDIVKKMKDIFRIDYDENFEETQGKSKSKNMTAKKSANESIPKKAAVTSKEKQSLDIVAQMKGIHEVNESPERVWIGNRWSIEVPVGYTYTIDSEKVGRGLEGSYMLHIQKSEDCNFNLSYGSEFNVVVYASMAVVDVYYEDLKEWIRKRKQQNKSQQRTFIVSADELPLNLSSRDFLDDYEIHKCTSNLVVLYKKNIESKEYSSYTFSVIVRGYSVMFMGQFNCSTGTIAKRKSIILKWLDTIETLTQEERETFSDYSGKSKGKIPTKYGAKTAVIDRGISISVPEGFQSETNPNIIGDARRLVIVPSNYSLLSNPMGAPVALSIQSSGVDNVPTKIELINRYINSFNGEGGPLENVDNLEIYEYSDKAFSITFTFVNEYYSKAFTMLFANNQVYVIHMIINYAASDYDEALALWDMDHLVNAWLARIQTGGERTSGNHSTGAKVQKTNTAKTNSIKTSAFVDSTDEYYLEKEGRTTRLVVRPTVKRIKTEMVQRWPKFDELVISEGVEEIEYSALHENENIKKVVVPGSIKKTNDFLFYKCKKLKEVEFKEGIEELGEDIFCQCEELERVFLPSTLRKIGASAFSWCKKLKTISLPDTLETIEKETFRYCDNLTELVIPEGVKTIGAFAFSRCYSLEKVLLPSTLETIDKDAFDCCGSLHLFVIPDGVKTIGENAFGEGVVILSGVPKKIKKQSFVMRLFVGKDFPIDLSKVLRDGNIIATEDITPLKTGYATQNWIVGDELYYNDEGWEWDEERQSYILVPEGIRVIREFAFAGCYMSYAKLPDSLQIIKPYAFMECKDMQKLTLPEGVEEIGEGAFSGCPIHKIVFGNKLRKIGKRAFEDCTVPIVYLPDSVEEIALDAFKKDTLLVLNGCYADAIMKVKEQNGEASRKKVECGVKLENLGRQILNNQKKSASEQVVIDKARNNIQGRTGALTEARNTYDSIQTQYNQVQKELNVERSKLTQKKNDLKQQKESLIESVAEMEKEKKGTFFLGFSKKAALSKQIEAKQAEIETINKGEAQAEEEFRKTKGIYDFQLLKLKEKLDGSLKEVEALMAQNGQDEEAIKTSERKIAELDRKRELIEEEKKETQDELDNITFVEIDYDAIRVPESIQKQRLIDSLSEIRGPEIELEMHFSGSADKSQEDKCLSEVAKLYEKQYKKPYIADAIKESTTELEQIKKINQKLALDEYDGIGLYRDDLPEISKGLLSYCESRTESGQWKKVRSSLGLIALKSLNKILEFLSVIPKSDYVVFKTKKNQGYFIVFPFGVFSLVTSSFGGLGITSSKLCGVSFDNVSVECVSNDYETFKPEENEEVIEKKYEHQRNDGTPDSRYKINREVYTVREWVVKIQNRDNQPIEINVRKEQIAKQIANAMQDYLKDFN